VEPASVLRNVLIQEAGSEDVNATAALVLNGPVLLEGVQVVDSGGIGVSASAFGAGSRVLRIHDSVGSAGEATAVGALDWPDALDFAGNEQDSIELWFVDLSESSYFEAKGYGFVQRGAIGRTTAQPDAPVLFGPEDGDEWAALEAWQGATVVIEHAVFDKGGSGADAALVLEVPITITIRPGVTTVAAGTALCASMMAAATAVPGRKPSRDAISLVRPPICRPGGTISPGSLSGSDRSAGWSAAKKSAHGNPRSRLHRPL